MVDLLARHSAKLRHEVLHGVRAEVGRAAKDSVDVEQVHCHRNRLRTSRKPRNSRVPYTARMGKDRYVCLVRRTKHISTVQNTQPLWKICKREFSQVHDQTNKQGRWSFDAVGYIKSHNNRKNRQHHPQLHYHHHPPPTPSITSHLGIHPLHVSGLLRGVHPREHAPALGGRLSPPRAAAAAHPAATPIHRGSSPRPRSDGVRAAGADGHSAVFRSEKVVVCVEPAGEQLRFFLLFYYFLGGGRQCDVSVADFVDSRMEVEAEVGVAGAAVEAVEEA